VPDALDAHPVPVTLFLIGLLGAVFLKGFKEAIGIAVALVGSYLALNLVVVAVAIQHVLTDPNVILDWRNLLVARYDNVWLMVGISLLLFPRLALGLSGFETGVVVMPLVKGDPTDTPRKPYGRIRNTGKLLTSAAAIMSLFLITSSLTTTMLIPHEAFLPGGPANGRALAYLAHAELGEGFGSIYDLSTILILWFAGASAMAGLLNIVPRYLPRYGMAPEWARAVRPLTLVFTGIAFAVTIIFRANVDAQGGAYATGVLVLITSAAFAVMLSARRKRRNGMTVFFGGIFLIFTYTTIVNMIERPDGLKIATFFIAAIIIVSLISRIWRSTELRATEVQFDDEAMRFLQEASTYGPIRLIANHPDERNSREYLIKEREEREAAHIPAGDPVMFLEVKVRDASDFASTVKVRGEEIGGYRVLSAESASVPNGIAATLLAIRNETNERPHIYFGWTEGNPLKYLARFVLFGEGDIAPVPREILRKAEPDRARRPAVHVG
jgi:hypothetical protein